MGSGIAAVAGTDSEPSPQQTDIEDAHSELRQELTGRNERQREVEFLEKGGDPLEFKFGKPPHGPRSLSSTGPFAQHVIFSGERDDVDYRKEEKSEDGLDLMRARGSTGKVSYQDGSATSISVDEMLSDALAATVTSSGNENDRKVPLKKEVDACKTSKVAVKGQYARRNRHRSNRFSSGLTTSQELGKVGTEGGPISSSAATSDAEANCAMKHMAELQAIANEVTRQSRDTSSKVAVVERQSMASDTVNVPDVVTTLPLSSMHRKSNESLALVLEVAKEETIALKDGGLDSQISAQYETQAMKSTTTGSLNDSSSLVAMEIKVPVVEDPSSIEAGPGHESGQSEELSGLKGSKLDKARPVLDDEASPARHSNMLAVTANLLASETNKAFDTVEKTALEYINQEDLSRSDATCSEIGLLAKDEDPSKTKISYTLEKDVNMDESLHETQLQGDIKVKVEDEAPSHSRISPSNVSTAQKAAEFQPQNRADGSLHAVSSQALVDDKMSVLLLAKEIRDLDVGFGIEEPCGSTAQNDTVGVIIANSKGESSQEGPRKCSHWDFVLQEMAWLANDFMQERVWKIAAAAQVARWVAKHKQQPEFEEIEICKRQRKLARGLSKAVEKFWQSIEGLLLKDSVASDSNLADEALKSMPTLEPTLSGSQVRPVQSYAARFLRNSIEKHRIPQAEAPPTPDQASEFGIFDFWEDKFSEECLFYTVPQDAMEVYRQSVVSEWEGENERRLREHEATMAELESHFADGAGPLVSPLVTGKRSSGFLGGSQTVRGTMQTKRMRTSAVAARHRVAGGAGPLVSIPVAHLARSDISSCETNSQQDEMTGFLEGSSVSGRATDVDSKGAFARSHLVVDGVDSPSKSRKKKKARHPFGHAGSIGLEPWQRNHNCQSEQKEQSKQKGDYASLGLEGFGTSAGSYHGATGLSSAKKTIKQISNRDRMRKHKLAKASLSQPGVGIPWSSIEDQTIIGLVHEYGLNWELVSDVLGDILQLRGIFRKPKDCKERYRILTDKGGGDGGDSPDDPNSSAHFFISYKGGTRYLPQHFEDSLKIHVDCILQLHQQLHNRKIQSESQESKQLVPEHESHAIKHTAMTPLELCELASASGEMVSHSYPLQPAGITSFLSGCVAMRSTCSAVTAIQGGTNLQISSSMSPSAAIQADPMRDAQQMGAQMRLSAAEEQRLRYSKIIAGRGLPNPGFSATSGSPVVNLPSTMDGTAPANLPSGNSAGMLCSLSRGMPMARTVVPGVGSMGLPHVSTGMPNVSNAGMVLSGAGVANIRAVSSPVNMMRPSREAISMGQSQSSNVNVQNPILSSSTQNCGVQQQLLQPNILQPQQQSPSSSQQQGYNLMRLAKERQQLQQQQQKRMLQQQQSPTSNPLQTSFLSSQAVPVTQQQQGLSPHPHLFPQHQQSLHSIMQQHALQEQQQQHSAPLSAIPQSAVSPSRHPSLSGGTSQSSQQQQLLQPHQSTSVVSPSQSPFHSKHQNPSTMQQQHNHHQQQQQHQQGKGIRTLGRGESQANLLASPVSPQPFIQGQLESDSQGLALQQSAGRSSAQNSSASMSHVTDAGVQQPFPQKSFSQHKHISQQHSAPMPTSSSIQPASPPQAGTGLQQQPSPGAAGSLPSAQHRLAGLQAQGQQRRPQQSQGVVSLGTNFSSQTAQIGAQASPVLSQLPAGYQLGANTNSPSSIPSPSSSALLASPNRTSSGGFASSSQWKPGQTFTPMAAGLYNLSRSNSGIAAQAPHLAMSVGMHLPLPNGKLQVTGNNFVTQDCSRAGSQHVSGHVGTLQKAPVAGVVNPRSTSVSHTVASQQRQVARHQLSCTSSSTEGQQLRPSPSGTGLAPE